MLIFVDYEPELIPLSLSPRQKRFLCAYSELPGHLADAARRGLVPRRTVYNWLRDDPDFLEAFNNVRDGYRDFVMSKLHDRIKMEDTRAIIFYLKTYAKDRGYF